LELIDEEMIAQVLLTHFFLLHDSAAERRKKVIAGRIDEEEHLTCGSAGWDTSAAVV